MTGRATPRLTEGHAAGSAPHATDAGYDELIIAAALTLWAALLALLGAPLLVRLPFGLLAVLFIPGFAAAALAFPGREMLDTVERLALSLGLSLAIVASAAVVLDRSPWGMGVVQLVCGLAACTVVLCALAAWQRSRLPPHNRFSLLGRLGWRHLHAATRRALLVLAGATLLSTVALTLTLAVPPPPLTQFYSLGPERLAENYPRTATVGQPVTLILGVVNREGRAVTYRIRVVDAADPSATLGEAGPILLADGARWEGAVSFTPSGGGADREFHLLLYEARGTSPHRTLRLWLEVLP